MRTKLTISGFFACALFLAGCSDSTNYDFDKSVVDAQTGFDNANLKAIFDPRESKIPPTNDLLFVSAETGLSKDGTLQIPVDGENDPQKLVKDALNQLDGFSTSAPVTAAFSGSLDTDSLKLGSAIRVFEVTRGVDQQINGIARELASPEDLVATAVGQNQTTLALVPTHPLKPKTTYLVVLTDAIKGQAGAAAKADTLYGLTKGEGPLTGDLAALEPLRQAVNGFERLAAGAGIAKDSIVLSWSFTTQSIGDVLEDVFTKAVASRIQTIPALNTAVDPPVQLTTKNFLDPEGTNPAITGKADVFLGAMSVPYYLNAGTPGEQNSAPRSGSWKGAGGSALTRFNTTPVKTTDLTIPVLITVPNAASAKGATPPEGGFPVVIFQHGITSKRTALLPIANALADAGFAAVAIDLALHGVDPNGPAALIHAGNTPFPDDVELTFDMDFRDNITQAPLDDGDGKADDSGSYFINLPSLLTSRDNVRQSVADLIVLRKSLGNIASFPLPETLPAIDLPALNANEVSFVGHSLGGIVGATYLAIDDTVGAATLAMPGGGIAQLLNASEAFGPVIRAGLSTAGLEAGTPEFESFLAAAQWVLDSADPINYASATAAKHPVHMIEVVGGNSSPADQVIPNSVATAPLSGTDPLARLMGLKTISETETTTAAEGLDVLVKFTAGDHSSILLPDASFEATVEMQTEVASFLASKGRALPIAETSVVLQP